MTNQKSILVADDDSDLLNTLVKALENEGYNVLSANDGKNALDIAKIHHPDLIIIDEMMPVLTGVEVVAELRKDEWGKNVEVIMLTNVDATNDVNTALKLGISDYLVKSDLHLPQIIEIIRKKLE